MPSKESEPTPITEPELPGIPLSSGFEYTRPGDPGVDMRDLGFEAPGIIIHPLVAINTDASAD